MFVIEQNYKWAEPLKKRSHTNYIVIHHRAGNGDVSSLDKEHKRNNGWAGIGYHFYVRKNGDIYRGRPIDKEGAHCKGHNYDSVGICFEGNFETETTMNDKQKSSGIELVNYLMRVYPNAVVTCHRNLYATACPGKHFPFENILGGAYNMSKELTSANDIIWELMHGNCHVPISDVNGAVKALENAQSDSRYSSLYWILRKIANNIKS